MTPTQVTCPQCSREWPFDYLFCPMDGQKLAESKLRLTNPEKFFAVKKVADLLEISPHLSLFLAETYGLGGDDDPAIGLITREWLQRALDAMPERWAQPLIRYYGLDGEGRRTQVAIGAEIGVSNTAIRRKIVRAQRFLRENYRVK